MTASNISSVFATLNTVLEKQEQDREVIRTHRDAADVKIRQVQHDCQGLNTATDLKVATSMIRGKLMETGALLIAIEKACSDNLFYKYCDLWQSQRQTLSQVCVMVQFLDTGCLATVADVHAMCGGVEFRLPLEDFLVGVCFATSDFVRFSMNRVIKQDFDMVKQCAVFSTHVFEAFRQLNLRNDFLRKRYDGMKYDVKRLEEMVYDLSIRRLISVDSSGNGVDVTAGGGNGKANDDIGGQQQADGQKSGGNNNEGDSDNKQMDI